MDKNMQNRGVSKKVYFDPEADDMLNSLAHGAGIERSNVVCALIRVAAGGKPRPGEEAVAALLKRAMGREQFLAFLRAVEAALPAGAKAIPCAKEGGVPEAWVLPFGSGVLAFFHPCEANVGDIFSKASKLMAEYALNRVIVATTNGHSLDGTHRQMLLAAGVELVALADLREELAKLKAKKAKR